MKKVVGFALAMVLGAFSARAQGQAAGVTLDEKNLQSFLTSMGYEAQKVDDSHYDIPTKAGTLAVTLTVEISANHENLWITALLRFLTDSGPLPADLLEAVMRENNDDFPRFYISDCAACQAGQKRRLRMAATVPNQGLTPVVVRKLVESMDSLILSTQKIWDSSAWPAPPAANSNKK
jgi:hypothetical protein